MWHLFDYSCPEVNEKSSRKTLALFYVSQRIDLGGQGGYNNPLWLYTYFIVSAHSICSLEVLGKTQQKFLTGAEEQCLH